MDLMGYYIMPKFGTNLSSFLQNQKGLQKIDSILTICYQLIGIMKIVHKAGRTYNDMKPQNVMISYKNKEVYNSEELDVTIIDFGFVDKYKNSKRQNAHIERSDTNQTFGGNPMFASLDHMKFLRTSRKDDIISMYYMMIHLICKKSFSGNKESL